jgi:glycogen debranching enzyme
MVETLTGSYALTSQRYAPNVVHPDGRSRITSFAHEPWPAWTYRLEDGMEIQHELFAVHGASSVVLAWRLLGHAERAVLTVRPFLSGRDPHALHRENAACHMEPVHASGGRVTWRLYPHLPAVESRTNGDYMHEPHWYRAFLYEEERTRGLDDVEDLASPGVFRFDLTRGEAIWILTALHGDEVDAWRLDPAQADKKGARLSATSLDARINNTHIAAAARRRDAQPSALDAHGQHGVPLSSAPPFSAHAGAEAAARALRARERRRRRFASPLHRAADAYIVRRGAGKTVIAGYPWFTDWGRDTFIALRGLCLATGRLEDARSILVEWAGAVSEGMLPNRFPERGEEPEYNSVDASLWYVVAVHDFLRATDACGARVSANDRRALASAVRAILAGYNAGTRYGIRADADGLLACGEPGVQLTWMDAKVGDRVVTPRAGKPVEIQALWLNALRIGAEYDPTWHALYERGTRSFAEKFWNEERRCLYDVVDADHMRGRNDPALRPNQIFAVGGLPFAVCEGERARRVVEVVEEHLLTPLGLRTLARGEPGYAPRYAGDVACRDGAYHQGTVWPWLLGPFVEAWVRVRGNTQDVRRAARERFLAPLLAHLREAGLGHISEIADAQPPHTPRGCPFQAWSVGEALRLAEIVLAEPVPARRVSAAPRRTRATAHVARMHGRRTRGE